MALKAGFKGSDATTISCQSMECCLPKNHFIDICQHVGQGFNA